MSVNEAQLKASVQQAIKNVLIDSKYNDEPITFGQAIVTHYFLQHMPQQHEQSVSGIQGAPVSHSQHLHNLTRSTSAHQDSTQQQVVQFDLVRQSHPEFKPHYGRKKMFKFEEEAACVKDVFQWDDGLTVGTTHKETKMRELQRSPSKWQSEQRDQYRCFIDSQTASKLQKKAAEQEVKKAVQAAKIASSAATQEGDHHHAEALPSPNKEAAQAAATPAAENVTALDHVASGSNLEKDHHNRKVRINKDALKKRAQSAKQKVKVDPTRENYKGPTRWLPDSAFTTYFGKPAFHAYGKGNTNPVVGGNIYGHYMLTHNVNPESGSNLPQYQQVYSTALKQGLQKNNGQRQPELPRKSLQKIQASKPVEVTVNSSQGPVEDERNPIMPLDGPKTVKIKLGPSKVQSIKILRPMDSTRLTINKQYNAQKPPKAAKPIKTPETRSKSPPPKQASFDEREAIKPAPVPFNAQQQQQFSHVDFAIDENQDIGEADECHDDTTQQQQENIAPPNGLEGGYVPLCEHPTGKKADAKELDPRYYQFAPACWTQRIRPAGRQTYRSENLYNVLTMVNDNE